MEVNILYTKFSVSKECLEIWDDGQPAYDVNLRKLDAEYELEQGPNNDREVFTLEQTGAALLIGKDRARKTLCREYHKRTSGSLCYRYLYGKRRGRGLRSWVWDILWSKTT